MEYCSLLRCAELAPCPSHSSRVPRLESPGSLTPTQLYETVKSVPSITRARFERNGRVRVEFNQLDFSLAVTDEKDRFPTEKKFAIELDPHSRSRPCPIENSVLLTVHDDSDGTVVVFKKHKETTIVEVWDDAGLIKTLSYGTTVDKEDFGPPLTDAYMSHAEIHKKQLVFVADEKSSSKGFWHGDDKQYLQRPDWGEGFKGRSFPKVVVLDLVTGTYRMCGSKGSTLMQPAWLSQKEIVCVKVEATCKLGLSACYQRRTSIIVINLVDGTFRSLTGGEEGKAVFDFSCYSPRVRPGTREILFLSREAVGTHQMSFRLRSVHADSLEKATLIDIVDEPLASREEFPGLYTSKIPSFGFVFSTYLLLESHWGLPSVLLAFNLQTHKLDRIAPPVADPLAACTLLNVQDGRVLASFSSPNRLPEVWAASIAPDGGLGDWVQYYHSSALNLRAMFTAESFNNPTRDGVGATSTESLLLRPLFPRSQALMPAEVRSPVVLFMHGGPHSAVSSDFGDLSIPILMACEGYTVLCTNYRGSIGYGEAALTSLPGVIGFRDVGDVLRALDVAIKLPASTHEEGVCLRLDESRVALYGGSHGGFLSAHLTTDKSRHFKAAAMRNPVTDFTTILGTSDIEDWTAFEVGIGTFGERLACANGRGLAAFSKGLDASDMETLWERSPMKNVAAVTTPTLLLLGTDDLRVPPSQGRQWGKQLQQRGVECTIYEYPDTGHSLGTAFAQAHSSVAAMLFFRKHLKDTEE